MADQEQPREEQARKLPPQLVGEGHRVGRKSPAPSPSVWRPDVTTLRNDLPMLPQEAAFPNDSPHHV